MTEANGHAPDYKQLRRKRLALEEQLRIGRLEQAASHNKRLLEYDQGWQLVGWHGELLDRLRDGTQGFSYPFSTAKDRRYGDHWPFWMTWQEHARLRAASRLVCTTSPLAAGALNAVTSAVVHTGLHFRAVARKDREAPKSLLAAVQDCLEDFAELNDWYSLQRELFRALRRDGEFFLRVFDQESDGEVCVRNVDAPQVMDPPHCDVETDKYGVISEPEDLVSIVGYWVAYDGHSSNGEQVPADEMIHGKANVDRIVKRGMPDFSYETFDAFRRAGKLLENMQSGAAIQAAIALIRQHNDSLPGQVDDFAGSMADFTRTDPRTGQTERVETFKAGHIVDMGGNTQYVAPPFAGAADSYTSVVQAALRQVAVRWNAPEWLVSADASNQNYSSSLVAESPFVKWCQSEQEDFKTKLRRVMWRVVRVRCEAGLMNVQGRKWTYEDVRQLVELECKPPTVEVRERLAEAQRNQIEISTRYKSPQIAAEEQGYDWDRVAKDLEAFGNLDIGGGGAGGTRGGKGGAGMTPLAELQGLQGLNAVSMIQEKYYAGKLPREAAIANLVILTQLPKDRAEALFPELHPEPPGGPAGGMPGMPGGGGGPGGQPGGSLAGTPAGGGPITGPPGPAAVTESWDEDKHPRDHGKFSSKPGAGGGGSIKPPHHMTRDEYDQAGTGAEWLKAAASGNQIPLRGKSGKGLTFTARDKLNSRFEGRQSVIVDFRGEGVSDTNAARMLVDAYDGYLRSGGDPESHPPDTFRDGVEIDSSFAEWLGVRTANQWQKNNLLSLATKKRPDHKTAVAAALAAGKHVPSEVLADYPDLQKKAVPESWDEDKHPRDKGKFASKPGAQGGAQATTGAQAKKKAKAASAAGPQAAPAPAEKKKMLGALASFGAKVMGGTVKGAQKVAGVGKAAWDKIPKAIRQPAAALFHTLEYAYIKANQMCREVAKERDLSDAAVAWATRTVAVVDQVASLGVMSIVHNLAHEAHLDELTAIAASKAGAIGLPVASLAYLAYSAARNPLAIYRAAKTVLSKKGHAHESSAPFDLRSFAGELMEAYDRVKDKDWFDALFAVALDATKRPGEALRLALAQADSPPA